MANNDHDHPGDGDGEDWDGLESLSQRVSAIQGHSEETAPDSASARRPAVYWRCAACDSAELSRIASGDWMCSGCGSLDYYRVGEQTYRRTGHGTWMYFPEGQEPLPPWLRAENLAPRDASGPPLGPPTAPPSQEPAQGASGAARRRRRRRHGGGRPDPEGDWGEQAESETMTHDSTVTVSSRPRDLRPDPRLPGPGAAALPRPPVP